MAAEAAQGEGEDGGEDAGLEQQHEREGGDAGVAAEGDGADDEDQDHGVEEPQHLAGFEEFHAQGGGEAADCEQALGDGEEIGAGRLGCAGFDLFLVSILTDEGESGRSRHGGLTCWT